MAKRRMDSPYHHGDHIRETAECPHCLFVFHKQWGSECPNTRKQCASKLLFALYAFVNCQENRFLVQGHSINLLRPRHM
jgi:hypothetical protein